MTSGLTTTNSANNKSDKNLEDDLYDEYVVEAPPHPSELLALGVDPSEIDANDPEKLKELYRKAKEEGKDKKTNSVLLARQRQKEEIEEKKKTREEWKFFDSITARVEQAVKESQKTLEQLKECSAVDKLTEPEYELRLSADEVFKSSKSVKQEKGPNNWIDFNDDETGKKEDPVGSVKKDELGEVDEFGCSRRKSSAVEPPEHIAKELLEDFGFDIRPKSKEKQTGSNQADRTSKDISETVTVQKEKQESKLDIDLRAAARPRPRPNGTANRGDQQEVDPFDTSYIAAPVEQDLFATGSVERDRVKQDELPAKALDPFDTSFVNL